jgi:hypothetical protein
MRSIGLAVLFGFGMIVALIAAIPIFVRSLIKGTRAFHPRGTVCRAEITALDSVVGPRLDGEARVRFARASGDESSTSQSIIGVAIRLGTDQDIALATFEALFKIPEGTERTDVTDYLANQYPSATPWHVRGLGVIWFRLIPDPGASSPKTGTRIERLDADIAAGRAKLVLEARDAPGPDGALRGRLAEVRLLERLPADDPKIHVSMFRTGRGVVPTGFRNGIRAILYPASQLGRSLRGG